MFSFMYKRIIKFLFDFIMSLIGFVCLLPIFLFLIILLTCVNKGTPFFIQHRPGKNNRIFKLIKFKTMNNNKDINGDLLPDSERLTNIGRLIRKLSLDEIPQLINVIKGDMSLVGPRPLLVGYLSLYNREQMRRHIVRPGITGWAQVNGRNAISWQQKFEYDVWYVEHCSFLLDMKILFLTILKVFKSEGISSNTSSTMEPFTGNHK
ncbi:undecaprenyl phosphate N,N'-diacetylbacillosamine 1-phosphate transferase [Parabacteroides sp. PH5-13]|nr:undecaprenyl phosphate N,N'-diacetylbacillosamine 1-phosphate transferase [Parabacteroides sp. PH5-39]MDH6319854.1 undecaprenyl phosphate N,N'-diacetylbacillosamine 1-phosphate transferase [Parabacteroides sp. PH5-13]MDH6323555.1 undecaprenyl phosphate N,N'-diacetylbacillosamine 1-phosphate transferase [Parabacteroides sp. PH5-8]MDH6384667.1 undecaprenyl phosphate N,N'-diacetylbacillosamine 1-phosphate transferase [Parabacteroides sp. PH5-17]MDH6394022.1 undecaprenyl phosphate N,N'-diacetylb